MRAVGPDVAITLARGAATTAVATALGVPFRTLLLVSLADGVLLLAGEAWKRRRARAGRGRTP